MKIALVVSLLVLGEALGAVLPPSFETNLNSSVKPNAKDAYYYYSYSYSYYSSYGDGAGTTAKPPQSSNCECGKANKADRIVGGSEVKPNHKYPWQVYLQVYVENGGITYISPCGGTIVNKRFVITAMHCIKIPNYRLKEVFVVPGLHKRSDATSSNRIKAKRLITRNDYNSPVSKNNDITIIELEKDLDFSKEIAPACLPKDSRETYAGKTATVSGWGHLAYKGKSPNELYEVQVPVLSETECKNTGYGSSQITSQMLCAGYKNGGKDSCQGDSGGPLTVEENGVYTLIGVVSFGKKCAEPNFPGVYVRVTKFLNWIHENIKAGDCKA